MPSPSAAWSQAHSGADEESHRCRGVARLVRRFTEVFMAASSERGVEWTGSGESRFGLHARDPPATSMHHRRDAALPLELRKQRSANAAGRRNSADGSRGRIRHNPVRHVSGGRSGAAAGSTEERASHSEDRHPVLRPHGPSLLDAAPRKANPAPKISMFRISHGRFIAGSLRRGGWPNFAPRNAVTLARPTATARWAQPFLPTTTTVPH